MWFEYSQLQMLAQEAEKPFYQESLFAFIAIIVAAAISVAGGFWYANRIRMQDYGWKLAVIMFSVLGSVIVITSMFPPSFGVDLVGGVTYVGQLNPSENDEPVTAQELVRQIKERIDPAGVREIVVRAMGDEHIEIIIPKVEDESEADRIWRRVVQAGFLRFRIVARSDDRVAELAIRTASTRVKNITEPSVDDDGNEIERVVASWVTIGRKTDQQGNRTGDLSYAPMSNNIIRDKRTGRILDTTAAGYTNEESFTKWVEAQDVKEVEILVLVPEPERDVLGDDLTGIKIGIDSLARSSVDFRLKGNGPRNMRAMTRQHINRPMGIVLDDKLLSAPVIQSVIDKQGQITGDFSRQDVEDLISILKGGALKTSINEHPISRDQVNSSIGRDLQQRGVFAIALSLGVVIVFMFFYYRFAGLVACLALLTNLALILAIVMLIKQPITLTGLAGLVLTVGMSVDANVLIFERIREEMTKGSNLRMAIRNGFGRATVTIVDANITTLITALVLYTIGTEQIRGFCVALILGILMSMYTAIFCSRVIFDIAEKRRWIKDLKMTRWVSVVSFDFVGKRKVALAISGLIILIGIGCAVSLGDKIFGHDLRGGTTARIVFAADVEDDDYVRDKLEEAGVTSVDGEKIQWEVTRVTGTANDSGAVFKIDSSLQPYDDSREEEMSEEDIAARREAYQSLQQILDSVFEGELVKYTVEVESGAGADAVSNLEDANRTRTEQIVQRESQSSRTIVSERAAIGSPSTRYVSFQEGGDATQQGSDPQTGDPNSQSTGDTSTGDVGSGDSGTSDQDTAGQDTAGQDTTGQDTTGQSNGGDVVDDQGNASGGEDANSGQPTTDGNQTTEPQVPNDGAGGLIDPSNPAETPEQSDEFGVSTYILSFNYPATESGLRQSILELAEEQGIGLFEGDDETPGDVKMTAMEGPVGAPSSLKWSVEITSNDTEKVASVIAATKDRYENMTYFSSISEVGGQIAQQAQVQALVAILLSLVGIVAYLWVRFQRVVFGLAAVVALVHDVLFVLGAIALTGYVAGLLGFGAVKISLPVVAAFLTIIGYSLNDTIVVFDRIREVRGKNPDLTGDMINRSIGQTLSRTVLTSFTTFVVVFILLVGGGDAIQGFAFALVVGVIVGTYSSIFVASPVLLWLIHSSNERAEQRKVRPTGA